MIHIQLTPLSYRIQVTPSGQLLGTTLYLTRYLSRFNHTRWDPRQRRSMLIRRFVRYDEKNTMLYLPHYDLQAFVEYIRNNNIPYTIEHVSLQRGAEVTIPLKSHIVDRNEDQTKAIHYLTTCPDSQRGLSSPPGFGKTYCTVRTLSVIGLRAMICMSGLVDQWKRAILEYTQLTEDDIYVIQGAASMTKLLLQIDKTIFPKIILCSLGTVRPYAIGDESYENYPPFIELYDRLRVGVKVVDEAHLNFFLTLMLDLQTNASINIALTATFDRGDYQIKQIFDAHYPHLMRFGEGVFTRYVDIFSYSYSLGNMLPTKAWHTQKGYNHSKFEEYLIRRQPHRIEQIYKTVYSPVINSHYINCRQPGQKLLIICSTVDMCNWMYQRLLTESEIRNNFQMAIYISETRDNVLSESDIIISTPGSAGTGTDIKSLRTVLMTVATGSENSNKQTLGRLRELPTGDTPNYVYTWCRDIQPHCNYQEIRRNTYLSRGKTFNEITL